jgi:hypothetical protein
LMILIIIKKIQIHLDPTIVLFIYVWISVYIQLTNLKKQSFVSSKLLYLLIMIIIITYSCNQYLLFWLCIQLSDLVFFFYIIFFLFRLVLLFCSRNNDGFSITWQLAALCDHCFSMYFNHYSYWLRFVFFND